MSDKVLVIIPALNEAASLRRLLTATFATGVGDVLVVDDGSSDETFQVARELGARAVRHPFNLGYGSALQTGYRYALAHGYSVVVQMDADGQHEPVDIAKLVRARQELGVNVVVGSRFAGGQGYRTSLARRVGMFLFRSAVRFHTGEKLTDVTSGFQALDREVLRFLGGARCPVDYPDADVLIMLHRAGFRIGEISVRMYPSRNKDSMHDGWKPIYYVFKMGLSILVTLLRGNEKPGPS